MVTEKQLANLIPAKKGEVRNPTGKGGHSSPIKKTLSKLLECKIENKLTQFFPEEMVTVEQAILLMQIAKAVKKGDSRAAEIILDRLHDKPKQSSDIEHSGDIDVKVTKEEDQAIIDRVLKRATVNADKTE